MAVRGGAYSGAGLGGCDDGLVIDLSAMHGVRVDPTMRTARVEGGCTWGDVDHASHAFGLATVSGIISTTGVGGLTTGGGHGHLTRQCGLNIDNLLEADLVLADGRFVTVSDPQYPDLFWAIRGGGGNFGVATSFLFQLHPVRLVNAGPTLWELEHSAAVLRWYRDFLTAAPESLNGFFASLSVPPGSPFPEHLHNRMMCGVVWCHNGPEQEARELLAAVHDAAETLPEASGSARTIRDGGLKGVNFRRYLQKGPVDDLPVTGTTGRVSSVQRRTQGTRRTNANHAAWSRMPEK